MSVKTLTFGCRLNTYETEVMKQKADDAGLQNAILVNTCAVTGEAVRQAKQAIRKARRENPDARIIVSGCAAQTEPETFEQMDEIDLIIGNDDKLKSQSYRALPEFGINNFEKVRVNDIFEVTENAPQMVDAIEGHTRAFVQVQNGCDHRCTFCIIPFGRGNSRSVPMGAVVDQIRGLCENGYREIVLTGVDATSYGADLPGQPSLGQLAKSILKQIPELERLRLSSIDSIEADKDLFDLIGYEDRFMPHLHLSLQHGADMILKRMKRRHLRQDAIDFCRHVKSLRPDMSFGADIIAGFPTETEEMFAQSVSLIDDCQISLLHVFPFSPREGTPAAKMPQLDRGLIKTRAASLRQKGEQAYQAHLQKMTDQGNKTAVLVEKSGMGRTENFTMVEFRSENGGALPTLTTGAIVNGIISGHNGKQLHVNVTAQELMRIAANTINEAQS
jgi:threonylcarbamoyladenosine tRNA methylthiotransferase MtaB